MWSIWSQPRELQYAAKFARSPEYALSVCCEALRSRRWRRKSATAFATTVFVVGIFNS